MPNLIHELNVVLMGDQANDGELEVQNVLDFVERARTQELCVIFPERGVMVCWNGAGTFVVSTLHGCDLDIWSHAGWGSQGLSPLPKNAQRRVARDYIIGEMQKRWSAKETKQ